ncbi:MAG: hypothetical protein JO286_02350 [Solirubrobacterales bacterium]|nr:hypothetical protein [Solirubrobacterales bacterium]
MHVDTAGRAWGDELLGASMPPEQPDARRASPFEPEGARALIMEAKGNRRKAKIVGAITAFLFAGALYGRVNSTESGTDVANALGQIIGAGFGFALMAYAVQLRRRNPHGVVLWLRRFRVSYGHRVHFHSSLGRASKGLVVPLTVQDHSFRASNLSTFARAAWVIPLALLMWAVPMALLIGLVGRGWAAGHRTVPQLAIGLLWSCIFLWLSSLLVRRAGYVTLTRPNGVDKAAKRLRGLVAGEAWIGGGVEVLKCEDAIWRAVVTQAMQTASAAIVDVTEPTENLYWELEQALQHVGPSHVILTVEEGVDTTHVTHAIRAANWADLEFAPDEWVRRSLLTYPRRRALAGPARRLQTRGLARRLEAEIAGRLATRPPAPVGPEARKQARRTRRTRALATFFAGGLAAYFIGNGLNTAMQASSWTSQHGVADRIGFIQSCASGGETSQRCGCAFSQITSIPAYSTPEGFDELGFELQREGLSGRAAERIRAAMASCQ